MIVRLDPGFACLTDDRGETVVYYVDHGGPAEKAGLAAGMTIKQVDGSPIEQAIEETMNEIKKYVGYSSERYLRFR